MVDCPKCRNGMHYIGTEIETEMLRENVVNLKAEVRYHCAECYTDVVLHLQQEVTLK